MQLQQDSKEQGLLGKLHPKERKLEGKIFYLDNVKKRSTALLLEAISLLGGKVESFLHKDVNFVVTGNQEGLKEEKSGVTKAEESRTSEGTPQQESGLCNDKRPPRTPRPVVCGSRGKALLEKAIRNNERLQGSSVLSNARSWGVKILYVDDVLLYLKQLTRASFSAKHKRPEKTCTKQSSPSVKAVALRLPYLKIEDLSRKYKPLHMQSVTFPSLWYCGRFSPFETPPPLLEKHTEQGKDAAREKKIESSIKDISQTPLSCNPSPCRPRKKDLSYCECCQQPFSNLEEHLQSDQHRTFVTDLSNYSLLDQLVVEMVPEFNPNPSLQSEEALNRPPSPIHDVCELEPLTDDEMENAIQDLKGQESYFGTPNPTTGPPSLCPGSPSSGVQFTIPNPAMLPADIEPLKPDTGCHVSNIQSHPPSPAMPVLNVEPQVQESAQLHTLCSLPDPYSLPPVLSPQVHYSSIMDPHSPYSEPPVLSPQLPTAEDAAAEGQTCEANTADSVSTVLLISVAEINAEGEKRSNQEGLVGFSGLECSSRGWEYTTLSPRQSRSLTRMSAVSLNPKKRCLSTSSEHSSSKRRKAAVFGYTEQTQNSAKPQSGCCLLFDVASLHHDTNVSLTCTTDVLPSKQTYTSYCFPAVPSFSPAPNQIDCTSKTRNSHPPVDFHNNKSHSLFSSQDSGRSLSHSTSICIESTLIPDPTTLSPSSDSEWDCDLVARLGPSSAAPLTLTEQNVELDKELLHTPCPWMHNTSYESHLHTVLQLSPPAASLCGDEMDASAFSRTLIAKISATF